jgi:hypothetical protein
VPNEQHRLNEAAGAALKLLQQWECQRRQRLVQSGFYEVALTLLFPGTVVPGDLTEPSRFKNPFARIRLFQILIPQLRFGDFFNMG